MNIDRTLLSTARQFIILSVCVSVCASQPGFPDEQVASIDASQKQSLDSGAIERIVQQLGSESHAQRREAFNKILQLGTAARAEVESAVNSSNRQIAESAKRLATLIKVVAKCQDPQVALDVADIFLEADEQNLSKLTERGLWDLAELFLDEHDTIEVRCQESFYQDLSTWYLIQQMIDHAEQQASIDIAWPIVSRLVPSELVYWTAEKIQRPISKQPEDEHERALQLYFSGKVDEALELNISPQLKYRLASRGFRWKLFTEREAREVLLGSQENTGATAAHAILSEIAGDRSASELLWRKALATSEDVSSFSEQDSQAAFDALLQEAPLNEPTSEDEDPALQKPAAFNQLVVALMLSGRTEPIERYLAKESPQAAFAFSVRNDYAKALEHLGLKSDLTNFEAWLPKQLKLARERLQEFERSAEPRFSQLVPAVNLGHAASILAGVGKREQAAKILQDLIRLARKFRGESDVWNRCILRWLNGDQWRETCIEVIGSDFEQLIPKDQRSLVLEKLFPQLGSNALDLLTEAPAIKGNKSDLSWPLAFEQLVHLERCDREYFGPSASMIVRSWIHRVAQQGVRRQPGEDDEEISFAESSSLLGLAKLANDWEDTTTAIELLGINSDSPIPDFDLFLLAARISLKANQFDVAVQCIDAVPAGPREQHWKTQVRMEALLSSGKIDQAEQQVRSNWMRMNSISWNGDRSAGYRVVDDFIEEKRWEEALEYAERNFAIDRSMNYYSFWQARQYSIVLQELEQHQLSSDVMRSIFLELLRPNSVIVRFFAANNDLDVIRYSAARERLSRAISLIQSDQFDLARQELDIAYRLYSQDIEPVVSCYPLLVKAGQQDFAQQLFTQFESALLNQIRQWPEDAMSLNNLAWMYAKCGVKLDGALDLSRKAVKLVPSSAVYLDTLAEVQYRRGEVDLAIETMRNCVRIDPRAPGYRKNLVRFSTGKP